MRKVLSIVTFLMVISQPVLADFDAWGDTTGLLTVGEPHKFNIYVRNLNDAQGSDYDVTLTTKDANCISGGNCNHLLHVSLQSDRILGLQQDQAGYH